MNLKQAWGWLMAGVVAAGLNASYHDGGLQWAHQAIERARYASGAVVALASGQADQFLAQAQMLEARDEEAPCRLATAMARLQTKFAHTETIPARFEVMSAREEAQLARLEANRARIEAQVARMRIPAVAFHPMVFNPPHLSVTCPRVHVITRIPRMNVAPPEVHVETMGAGPV